LFSIPFFFVGVVISAAFSAFAQRAGKLYAFDLIGASIGSLSVVLFLSLLGGEGAILLVGIIASLIPLLIWGFALVDAAGTNITGKVKSGGVALSDAKATAEKADEYKTIRTDGSGNFNLSTTTTNAYTVDSAKGEYTRDRELVYCGGVSPDHTISTRSYADVKFKVAYDNDNSVTLAAAKAALNFGEPWYTDEHSIDFIDSTASHSWGTNGVSSTCSALLADLVSETNWPTTLNGADMLFGYSAENVGATTKGCMYNTGSYAAHPAIVVISSSPDITRTVMHEVTHAYGLGETNTTCISQVPNIMATASDGSACPTQYIKNWNPSQDDHMETHRLDW